MIIKAFIAYGKLLSKKVVITKKATLMARIAVVYRSTSGFTKKYAEWISEELKADLFNAKKINIQKLREYNLIVFGGSLHAVGINGLKLIKDNASLLADKDIIVFAVGASPPRPNVLEEVKKHNFGKDMAKVKLFYFQGGFNFDKLDLVNKVLMTLFRVSLKLKRHRTPDEIGMLAAYSKPMDFTRRENIRELIEYARSIYL